MTDDEHIRRRLAEVERRIDRIEASVRTVGIAVAVIAVIAVTAITTTPIDALFYVGGLLIYLGVGVLAIAAGVVAVWLIQALVQAVKNWRRLPR